MQHIRLLGKIETPIVSKKNYKLGNFKIAIASKDYLEDVNRPYESYSKPRFYGKCKSYLKNGEESSRPFNFMCHMGFIHLDFLGDKKDILEIAKTKQFGRFKNEGMGRVRWEKYKVFDHNQFDTIKLEIEDIKLKKINLKEIPEEMYPLLTAGLIHDFVLIPKKHPSKLGNFSINIKDENVDWLVENHHAKTKNLQLRRLQKADRLASIINRKHMQPVKSQFGFGKRVLDKKEIFEVVENVESRLNNFEELYEYIWKEERLDNFVESQKFGLSSLRKHLLLTVQLMLMSP